MPTEFWDSLLRAATLTHRPPGAALMPSLLVAALIFVFPSVAVSTVGGASYTYVLLLLAGLVWGRGWRTLGTPEKRLLLGFVVVLLVMISSLATSQDTDTGFQWLERYARIASIGLIYPMLVRLQRPFHRVLGAGAMIAVFLLAAQAWYEVARMELERATGAYHPIVFGDVAVLWGCVGILFLLTRTDGWVRAVGVAGTAAAATFASVLSGSRGSWLFVLAAPLILAVLYRRALARSRQARLSAAAVVVVAVGIGLWQSDHVAERVDLAVADIETFAEDPVTLGSWGMRLSLWRNTLLLVREDPVFGAGLGSFQAEMRDMVADGRSLNPHVVEYANAHSIYFDALSNAGLVGLIVMIGGLLVLPLWTFGRKLAASTTAEERYCSMGGLMTVLGFAIFGLSEVVWLRNAFVNAYVVCVAVFLAGLAGVEGPSEAPPA